MGGFRNQLYFGDNLEALRDKVPDESVDLVCLDPLLRIADRPDVLRHRRCLRQSIWRTGRPEGRPLRLRLKKDRNGI